MQILMEQIKTEELEKRLRSNGGTFTRDQVYTYYQKEQQMSHHETSLAVEYFLRRLRSRGAIIYEGHRNGWRFI